MTIDNNIVNVIRDTKRLVDNIIVRLHEISGKLSNYNVGKRYTSFNYIENNQINTVKFGYRFPTDTNEFFLYPMFYRNFGKIQHIFYNSEREFVRDVFKGFLDLDQMKAVDILYTQNVTTMYTEITDHIDFNGNAYTLKINSAVYLDEIKLDRHTLNLLHEDLKLTIFDSLKHMRSILSIFEPILEQITVNVLAMCMLHDLDKI